MRSLYQSDRKRKKFNTTLTIRVTKLTEISVYYEMYHNASYPTKPYTVIRQIRGDVRAVQPSMLNVGQCYEIHQDQATDDKGKVKIIWFKAYAIR